MQILVYGVSVQLYNTSVQWSITDTEKGSKTIDEIEQLSKRGTEICDWIWENSACRENAQVAQCMLLVSTSGRKLSKSSICHNHVIRIPASGLSSIHPQ